MLIALEEICADSGDTPESIQGADDIINQINFNFICHLVMWDKILNLINKVSMSLQAENMTIDVAEKLLAGLIASFNDLRQKETDHVFREATKIAVNLDLEPTLPEKRSRTRRKYYSDEAEETILSPKQAFRKQYFEVIDSLLACMQRRCESLKELNSIFSALAPKQFCTLNEEELKCKMNKLASEYPDNLNGDEMLNEIQSFKHEAPSLLDSNKSITNCTTLDLLKLIHQFQLHSVYPNLDIAFRIFLTIPATTANAERSFSK